MEGFLYIIGSGFLMYLIFKFARQLFFKLLVIVLLVGAAIFGLYYFKIGPFKSNVAHIETIKEKYCQGQTPEICNCIVSKLAQDINSRFSPSEMEAMRTDRLQCAYVFQKSMSKINASAKECLKTTDSENLWKVFIKETLQIDHAVTDKIEALLKEGKTAIDDSMNEVKDKKGVIDNKY